MNKQPEPTLAIYQTQKSDAKYIHEWLQDEDGLRWFPISTTSSKQQEIDFAVKYWIECCNNQTSLTALMNGKPCGIATLFMEPYKKVSHHSELGILVAKQWRNQGIGSALLSALFHLAHEKFRMEFLHLLVYATNPAISLYQRFGFTEYGRQTRWVKNEKNEYLTCLFMEADVSSNISEKRLTKNCRPQY